MCCRSMMYMTQSRSSTNAYFYVFVNKIMLILFQKHCCCYCLVAQSCPTLFQPHGLQPTRLLCSWDFPGKNTGVGCHFLLQGIFLTQGLNLCLLHWIVGFLPLSHQESPLERYQERKSSPSHLTNKFKHKEGLFVWGRYFCFSNL